MIDFLDIFIGAIVLMVVLFIMLIVLLVKFSKGSSSYTTSPSDDYYYSRLHNQNYSMNTQNNNKQSSVSESKPKYGFENYNEPAWSPLSDPLEANDFHCPICDQDLMADDCEHSDYWS